MKEKICTKCNILKKEKDFYSYKKRSGKIGFLNFCKKCKLKHEKLTIDKERVKIYKKQYHIKNKEKRRDKHLQKNYKLNLIEYNILLESQNYVCKICKKPESAKNVKQDLRLLSVDHCHISGRVRGLLCQRCNSSLGLLFENEEILNNMIEYIKNNK